MLFDFVFSASIWFNSTFGFAAFRVVRTILFRVSVVLGFRVSKFCAI